MEDFPEKVWENPLGKFQPATYCVTGANGFIGSWLVKILLQNGFTVHATLRNPAKSLYLMSTWTGSDRLRLFRADMREEGSFDEAVKGCDGVFHVAASMEFSVDHRENIEDYVQSDIIDPAINGTVNLLRSCLKSKSVKRVVLTSSISTLTAKDVRDGKWRAVVDESCQTSIDHVWKTKPSGWVYALAKLLSEEAAYKFASENGIDIVSVITSTVAGPFLTSNIPSSIRVLLSLITGEHEFLRILSAVNERMGSIAVVHTDDICRAHMFLMQTPNAKGRYLCCATSCTLSELVEHISRARPSEDLQRWVDLKHNSVACEISSKKLRDLGFEYEHGIEDIIHQTITSCLECGFL